MGGGAGKLSEADRLLLTLWSAKMSTASIAMMLGGRWTEARVYNRLAALREAEAGQAPPIPEPEMVAAPDPAGVRRICAGLLLLAAGLVTLREVLEHQEALARVGASEPEPVVEPSPIIAAAPRASLKPSVIAAAVPPPTPCPLPTPANPPFIQRQKDYSGAEDDIIRAAWRDHPGRASTVAHSQLDGRTIGSIRYRAFMLGLRQDGGSRQDGAQPRSRAAKGRRPVRQPEHTAQRIKPLTPIVLRFAGWFHVADWPVDEIADLFDLDVDGLGLALGVKAGAAA